MVSPYIAQEMLGAKVCSVTSRSAVNDCQQSPLRRTIATIGNWNLAATGIWRPTPGFAG
jgi:hypothetical protein